MAAAGRTASVQVSRRARATRDRDGHRARGAHGAGAGTWWTGAERVVIAAESRAAADCGLCRARKGALSPAAVGGEHEAWAGLPALTVDVIHRVRTDAGRLTQE